MTDETLGQCNHVPEGVASWLTDAQHQTLKRLFEAAPPPQAEMTADCGPYHDLHRFLSETAGLTLPLDEAAIHYTAFVLIRRGYQAELIMADEYERLCRLMEGLAVPDPGDMDLHERGGYRALYDYLATGLGISVLPGRGAVWQGAADLVRRYETGRRRVEKAAEVLGIASSWTGPRVPR